MKWAKGDKVMAKWPGSALYYAGEIVKTNEDESADVLFTDGTEMEIQAKHIMAEGAFKRSKSPSRRSRSRSRGRSPSRKKQVSKKSKAPTSKTRQSRSSSRSRRQVVISSSSEKKTVNTSVEQSSTGNVTTSTITKSVVEISSSTPVSTDYMMTRHRLRETNAAAKLDFSAASLETSTTNYPIEYGGTFGVFLFYLTTPLLPLFMLLVCNERDCSVSKFKYAMVSRRWQTYFNLNAFVVFFAFMLFHAIIYALPLGHIIKGPATPKGKRLDYRISAPYTLIIMAITYAVLVFRYKISLAFVHDQLLQLAVAGIVISFAMTLLLFIGSFWMKKSDIHPAANTGSYLYDSFIGRSLHPRIGNLFDLKLFFYRVCMGGWMIMIWIEMQRSYNLNGKFTTPFLIITLSQIAYNLFAFFLDEGQCPFMFDIKNEALGFPQYIGEIVVVPFVYTYPVRYVMNFPPSPSIPMFVLIATFLLTGFILVFWSQKQKTIFRKDAYDSRVAGVASLPSSKVNGDRLIVSGLWGFVRHPNYLGEILIGIGWGLTCGFRHLLPWFYPVFIALLLCHRSLRDEIRCRAKHGLSWKIYCDKVKYRVIPGVF